MAISVRGNGLLSRLIALAKLKRFNHTSMEGGSQAQLYADSVVEQRHIDTSKWKKVDSRTLGITPSMISVPSWIVLKVLQSQGFEAYLVGGCVRDLLLNKIPKDFDVVTTAKLRQIRKQFNRAEIVGRRFPICRVHVKGSVIEVSSFETVAGHAKEKEVLFSQMPSGCDEKDFFRWRNCMHRDFTINSLFFDPLVNKIYDYTNGMMDLRSLKLRTLIPAQLSFKEDCARILRGLRIAARLDLSFSKETETAMRNLSSSIKSLDKSRIMMELNYMLSYGAAEPSLCLLRRFNLLDILLPFHAAYLAQQASKQYAQNPMMLMKLFFNLDKLVTCDRPSDRSLWVGLLAFHLALLSNPQEALVVWTFSSVLYYGNWKEGVKFAREHTQFQVNFVPEFSEACDSKSDGELAKKVTQLALLVQASIDAFTETDSLLESMSRYPVFPCSGLVFISKKTGKDVAQIFNVLLNDIESYKEGRESFKIDYNLLGKGNLYETRFALGKVIMDTMSSGVARGGREVVKEKNHLHDHEQKLEVVEKNCHPELSNLEKHHVVVEEDKKRSLSPSIPELQQDRAKKQKLMAKKCNLPEKEIAKKEQKAKKQKLIAKKCNLPEQEIAKKKQKSVENTKCQQEAKKNQEVVDNKKFQEMANKHQKVVKKDKCCISQDGVIKKQQKVVETCLLPHEEIIVMQENVLEREKYHLPQQGISEKKQKVVENEKCQERSRKHQKVVEKGKCHISKDGVTKKHQTVVENCNLPQEQMIKKQENNCHLPQQEMVMEKNEKHRQELDREKRSRPLLSSYFKRI